MASGVQARRDGDRFHYVLVAHRLLQLLELDGPLTAVSVEEVPAAETGSGDDVVDFVEYYGGTGAASCQEYTDVQVKHSTL